MRDYSGLAIHFSGSLVSDHVIGAHPLQSFNTGLYTLEQYQQIPFVIDHDAPDFKSLLPGLMNHHVRLNKSKKSKYHALCVLSGNFSCLLWQKLFSSLEDEFHLPKEIAHVYLRQQMQNLLDAPENALTGPLVRGDTQTISRHLRALTGDEFKDVYASFVACYDKMNAEGMA